MSLNSIEKYCPYQGSHQFEDAAGSSFLMSTQGFVNLPGRLFLDSSTLQALDSYGEFIYDGGFIDPQDRLWSVPDGPENVQALKDIMLVGQRASWELVLSTNSVKEVSQKDDPKYLLWAFGVMQYWESVLGGYRDHGLSPLTGNGVHTATMLESPAFGYLSKKDKTLLVDALILECDAFITLDRRLFRNRHHFESQVPLRILEPLTFWELLKPWAGMFV